MISFRDQPAKSVVPVRPQCRAGRDFRFRILDFRFGSRATPWATPCRIQNPKSKFQNRAAATLTEVLMAILIMGVGVVSVFTLFPISILRAIQATTHTNAKILKLNAEEQTRTDPTVLDTNAQFAFDATVPRFRGQWQPNTQYVIGDIVTPTVKAGSPFPSPHLWFQRVPFNGPDPDLAPLNSGRSEPTWNLSGAQTIDVYGPGDSNGDGELDTLTWQVLPRIPQVPSGAINPVPQGFLQVDAITGQPVFPINGASPNPVVSARAYVVDPLGWSIAAADVAAGGPPPFPINEFGNRTDATGLGNSVWGGSDDLANAALLRINGGFRGTFFASAATTLPDSWEQVIEAAPALTINADPTGPTSGEVVFPPTIDLSGIGGQRRIVLTSSDGTITAVREILPGTGTSGVEGIDPATRTVRWSSHAPLPVRMLDTAGNPDVGYARIENFDRRYSWFMTVKKSALGRADIKLVVVFKRSLSAADEHVYDANFGNPDVDIDGNGTMDGPEHVLGTFPNHRSDWVKISWGAGEPTPLIKPGNFLFDARDCEWYRIREVLARDDTTSPRYAVLILDRTVQTTTLPAPDGGGPYPATPPGRAILMRGIIDVYDL